MLSTTNTFLFFRVPRVESAPRAIASQVLVRPPMPNPVDLHQRHPSAQWNFVAVHFREVNRHLLHLSQHAICEVVVTRGAALVTVAARCLRVTSARGVDAFGVAWTW